jgi:hypothetical protein
MADENLLDREVVDYSIQHAQECLEQAVDLGSQLKIA